MAAVLAPARLSFNSAGVDAHEWSDDQPIGVNDSLRALVTGQSKLPGPRQSHASTTVFCATLPDDLNIPDSYATYRDLGLPLENTMGVEGVIDARSSSFPELSDCRSSKSTLSLSSSSSEDEVSFDGSIAEQSSHSGETAPDDTYRDSAEDSNLPPDSRPTLRRPPQRSSTLGDFRSKMPSPPLRDGPYRPRPRPRFPSLDTPVASVLQDQSRNLPHGRTMARTSSVPNSPFTALGPDPISSRSPSPKKASPLGRSRPSPQASTSALPAAAASPRLSGSWARRLSWQPERKTAAQLEAEYDDEDGEVPDGAILENVPISPMPGQYSYSRSASAANLHAQRSHTPSPQRRPSYANLHSANIPKGAKRPSAPPIMTNGHFSPMSPRSPRSSRMPGWPPSATFPYLPPEYLVRPQRSQSWTEDLNEEARKLSQALEAHTGRSSWENQPPAKTDTAVTSPRRPSWPKSRAVTTASEISTLASVQKGNILIDPLPISKEKEAALTRTRPSWLPPKSKSEEKRHLKEFQQMMSRAADAEKKRAIKDREDRESREEMQGSIARIWEQHVLPNWDAVIKEPRTRELWWRGVTPPSRGQVWRKAVGNELELSAASFDAALARAKTLEASVAELPAEERAHSKESAWFDAIVRDVPMVYPDLNMFQPGAPLHQSLTDVLKAYAMYRRDVGYVFGTHLVAGIVCMLLPPAEAFVLLANLLNRPLPLAFLVHDQVAMGHAYEQVLDVLKYKFTKLHDHLTSPALGLNPAEYLDPLFRCLFAYNLAHGHACRVWDIFVFEGDKALIRAAVAVLGRLESRLYVSKEEVLQVIGWRNERLWEGIGPEEDFVKAVREAGKVDGVSGSSAP